MSLQPSSNSASCVPVQWLRCYVRRDETSDAWLMFVDMQWGKLSKQRKGPRRDKTGSGHEDGEFLLSARRVGPVFLLSYHSYFPDTFKPHAGLEEQVPSGRYVAALVPVVRPTVPCSGGGSSSSAAGSKYNPQIEDIDMDAVAPYYYALRLVGCGCLCRMCQGPGGCCAVDERCRLVGVDGAVGGCALQPIHSRETISKGVAHYGTHKDPRISKTSTLGADWRPPSPTGSRRESGPIVASVASLPVTEPANLTAEMHPIGMVRLNKGLSRRGIGLGLVAASSFAGSSAGRDSTYPGDSDGADDRTRRNRTGSRADRDRARRRRTSIAAAASAVAGADRSVRGSAGGGALAAASAALAAESSMNVPLASTVAVREADMAYHRPSIETGGSDPVADIFSGIGEDTINGQISRNADEDNDDDDNDGPDAAFPASLGLTSPQVVSMEEGRVMRHSQGLVPRNRANTGIRHRALQMRGGGSMGDVRRLSTPHLTSTLTAAGSGLEQPSGSEHADGVDVGVHDRVATSGHGMEHFPSNDYSRSLHEQYTSMPSDAALDSLPGSVVSGVHAHPHGSSSSKVSLHSSHQGVVPRSARGHVLSTGSSPPTGESSYRVVYAHLHGASHAGFSATFNGQDMPSHRNRVSSALSGSLPAVPGLTSGEAGDPGGSSRLQDASKPRLQSTYSSLELEPSRDVLGIDIDTALAAGGQDYGDSRASRSESHSHSQSQSREIGPPRLVPAALASDLRMLLRREVLRVEVSAAWEVAVRRRAALRALRHKAVRGRRDRLQAVGMAALQALSKTELIALGLADQAAEREEDNPRMHSLGRSESREESTEMRSLQSAWSSSDRRKETPTKLPRPGKSAWAGDSRMSSRQSSGGAADSTVAADGTKQAMASTRHPVRRNADGSLPGDDATFRTLAVALPMPSVGHNGGNMEMNLREGDHQEEDRWASSRHDADSLRSDPCCGTSPSEAFIPQGQRGLFSGRWLLVPVWCPLHHPFRSKDREQVTEPASPMNGSRASTRGSLDSAIKVNIPRAPIGSPCNDTRPALPWTANLADPEGYTVSRSAVSASASRTSSCDGSIGDSSKQGENGGSNDEKTNHALDAGSQAWTMAVSRTMKRQMTRGPLGMPGPPDATALGSLLVMMQPASQDEGDHTSKSRGRASTGGRLTGLYDSLLLMASRSMYSEPERGVHDGPDDLQVARQGQHVPRRRSRLQSSDSYGSGSASTEGRDSVASSSKRRSGTESATDREVERSGESRAHPDIGRRPLTADVIQAPSASTVIRTGSRGGRNSAQVTPAPLTDDSGSESDSRQSKDDVVQRKLRDAPAGALHASALQDDSDHPHQSVRSIDTPSDHLYPRPGIRAYRGSKPEPVVGVRLELGEGGSRGSISQEGISRGLRGVGSMVVKGHHVSTAVAMQEARRRRQKRRSSGVSSSMRAKVASALSPDSGSVEGQSDGRADSPHSPANRDWGQGVEGYLYAAHRIAVPFSTPPLAPGILVARSRLPAFVLRARTRNKPGNKTDGSKLEALLGVQFEGGRDRVSKGSSKNFVLETPMAALVSAGVRLALPHWDGDGDGDGDGNGDDGPAGRGVPPVLMKLPRMVLEGVGALHGSASSEGESAKQVGTGAGAGAGGSSGLHVPLLQFGRSGQRRFSVDFLYPLVSPAYALGALLSCFSHAVVERAEAEGALPPRGGREEYDDRGKWGGGDATRGVIGEPTSLLWHAAGTIQ